MSVGCSVSHSGTVPGVAISQHGRTQEPFSTRSHSRRPLIRGHQVPPPGAPQHVQLLSAHLPEHGAMAPCTLPSSLPDAISTLCLSSLLDDAVPSSTSESSALSRKRFTLQGLANLKGQKGKEAVPPTAFRTIFLWQPLVPHTAT